MKKALLVLTAAAMFAACNNEKKDEAKTAEPAKVAVKLPYSANYSESFEMGNPAYSAMIEQGSWKDWETNKMDNMKTWVADSIIAYQSDNTRVKGADSLMANWKRGRANYTAVIDSIDAVIPVYSTDKKENWVLVWATEIHTDTKGKKDTVATMETWRINKDGKADRVYQFDRANRKK